MALDPGLDTGPIYSCETVSIGDDETVDELRARLVALGTALLIDRLAAGLGEPAPQEGDPTYAAKVDPAELELDFARPAHEAHRVVRLGRAWTTFRGARLHVLEATAVAEGPPPGVLQGVVVGCGGGTGLELVRVKPEGRKEQAATAWQNGARPQPGERFGANH
jgi:methionyl-tRNA formyltransferase